MLLFTSPNVGQKTGPDGVEAPEFPEPQDYYNDFRQEIRQVELIEKNDLEG